MSNIRFTGLPVPPPGEPEWCGACAAFYKGAVIEAQLDRVKEAEGDGKTGTVWLSPPKGADLPPLDVPVMTGTSMMAPMLGTTRLCWTHATAVGGLASRLDIGQGPLPPGLARGRG